MISVPYEVKKALRDGMLRKNYRFVILNDDGTEDFTIDNDTLVSESVNIDERMCSGDILKFGLCEGCSLEFQYFNHPNIYGRRIHAFIDVEYDPAEDFYPIPMGFFDVQNCSRQASTGIMKITAYNKLMSDYLNAKANLVIKNVFKSNEPLSVYDLRSFLLSEYTITEDGSELGTIEYPDMTITPSWDANLGTFKFNSLYGKKSPINACEFGITSTSTTFTLRTYADIAEYYLPAKCRMGARFGELRGLEEHFVEYFKKIINDADLDKDWDDVLDYVCTHDGFQSIIGICAGDYLDPEALWYSTVQWDYEEAHGLPHTVAGKIIDAQRLTTGSKGYVAVVPGMIFFNGVGFPWIYYDGRIENPVTVFHDYYEYYTDDTLTTKATEPMPYVTFSDGTRYQNHDSHLEHFSICAFEYENLSPADQVVISYEDMPELTLRDVQSAVYETLCQFGQLSRETDLFSGVELNHGGLYPADTLYPANDLYPGGAVLSGSKSMYSKLWADEGNVRKWKYLIITYKTLDGEGNEIEKTLQRTIDEHGTDNYNMSDNWIFRNFVWTDVQVAAYAEAMVPKMRDIIWFPFEMWCAGLPHLEVGDEIEIPLKGEVYTSYVLQRQLKGIQNLQDTYINGTLDIF